MTSARKIIALTALGACILAPSASAAVNDVNAQPPTYDRSTQTITVVINVQRGLFASGALWGLDPSSSCDIGIYCYVRATFYAIEGGKQILTTPCVRDTSGMLHRFLGQVKEGEDGETTNGPIRLFPCF